MPKPDVSSGAARDGSQRPADAPPPANPGISPYLALLPLRFFLGAMLLYAGLDKLLTPGFLDATGPGSIGEQLQGFVRVSPLAPLITAFALPMPVLVGLLIALAEIAVGIGTLAGLAYRASAVVGALLSLMFWLTASWTVHPYYLGPDLPYAAGWVTLALAGHGGLYVLGPAVIEWFGGADGPLGRTVAANGRPVRYGRPVRMPARWTREVSPERRALLEVTVIGFAAVAVGAAGGLFGRLLRGEGGRGDDGGIGLGSGTGSSTGAGSGSGATATATPDASSGTAGGGAGTATGSGSGGTAIAKLSDLPKRSALEFSDPTTGDPSVLVRLADGKVVAFDAICTHAGCVVGYDSGSGLLLCPCHGAAFDPTHDAQVVGGPAPVPLASLPIHVDSASGTITVSG